MLQNCLVLGALRTSNSFKAFVSRKDTFVTLPTGYGKSIIYAALSIIFDHLLTRKGNIMVGISPLTSLMIDQRDEFGLFSSGFVGEA